MVTPALIFQIITETAMAELAEVNRGSKVSLRSAIRVEIEAAQGAFDLFLSLSAEAHEALYRSLWHAARAIYLSTSTAQGRIVFDEEYDRPGVSKPRGRETETKIIDLVSHGSLNDERRAEYANACRWLVIEGLPDTDEEGAAKIREVRWMPDRGKTKTGIAAAALTWKHHFAEDTVRQTRPDVAARHKKTRAAAATTKPPVVVDAEIIEPNNGEQAEAAESDDHEYTFEGFCEWLVEETGENKDCPYDISAWLGVLDGLGDLFREYDKVAIEKYDDDGCHVELIYCYVKDRIETLEAENAELKALKAENEHLLSVVATYHRDKEIPETVWVLRQRQLDKRATKNPKFDARDPEEQLFCDELDALRFLWQTGSVEDAPADWTVADFREKLFDDTYYWGLFPEPASNFDMRCAVIDDEDGMIFDDRSRHSEPDPPPRIRDSERWAADEAAFLNIMRADAA